MVRKEPIVDRDFNIHGFEVLTWHGKFGNDRKALSVIFSQAEKESVRLFINLPPSVLLFQSREIHSLLLELNSIVPIVVEILEVEPYDPKAFPRFPFPYAVDDWGTGFSNLSVLLEILELPNFAYVKIDRTVFVPLLREKVGRKFLTCLSELITEKGKTVVFEKVESEREFMELCYLSPEPTLFQGFYISRVVEERKNGLRRNKLAINRKKGEGHVESGTAGSFSFRDRSASGN